MYIIHFNLSFFVEIWIYLYNNNGIHLLLIILKTLELDYINKGGNRYEQYFIRHS